MDSSPLRRPRRLLRSDDRLAEATGARGTVLPSTVRVGRGSARARCGLWHGSPRGVVSFLGAACRGGGHQRVDAGTGPEELRGTSRPAVDPSGILRSDWIHGAVRRRPVCRQFVGTGARPADRAHRRDAHVRRRCRRAAPSSCTYSTCGDWPTVRASGRSACGPSWIRVRR